MRWVRPLVFATYLYGGMYKLSYYIINAITLYRLTVTPLLGFLAVDHQLGLFKWLLAVSFFTDAIDGYLSRRYKVTSILGSKLDSIADDLTITAAIVGILVFKPELIRHELVLVGVLLGLFILQATVALIRYRKMTSFHTYMAKIAAVSQGIFLLMLFFLPEPPYAAFYIAAIITIFDLLEEIILVLILPRWQANVKGLYWLNKKTNQKDHH
jgi:CDP-diacylglycerol--glycerol-3-phosphate 3-phosphatidyltransferase